MLQKKTVLKQNLSIELINRKMTFNREKYSPGLKWSERQVIPSGSEACLYRAVW